MSEVPPRRRRLVSVLLQDRESGEPVAEWRLVDGAVVTVRGAATCLAEEVAHGVVLSGPYATAAENIGPAYGIRVGAGRVEPSAGGAYIVALMAWLWYRRDVEAISMVEEAG